MGKSDSLSRASSRVNSEQVMLMIMLLVAGYMFIGSYDFSWAAAFFPRFMAAMTIIGASLLLFRNYLPGFLQQYVTTSVSIVNEDVRAESTEEIAEEAAQRAKAEQAEAEPSEDLLWGSNPGLITVLLMAGYILASFLVGMLWMTPVFVFAYLVWFRVRLSYAAILSAVSFVLAYTFMTVLLLDIDGGILFEGGLL
ncbi:tripartite tricarboxylate transporter TctB family protein [Halobellus rubicundus]|uniref:Tripartite tricarboxylate transporter TctB family protein n=1 Tax=Halobellus rubicundus TaxID=2996466 RepID=A0ABD5MIU1_9EURY